MFIDAAEVSLVLFYMFVVAKLSLYSGVLALGVGDSIAALSGRLFGKRKWPGMACKINTSKCTERE